MAAADDDPYAQFVAPPATKPPDAPDAADDDPYAKFVQPGPITAKGRRTVVPYASESSVQGLVEPGNIEVWNRPAYFHPDYKKTGNYGTTESFSKKDDRTGAEVLVPQIINGKYLTQDQAWAHYLKTGQHLGKFKTPEEADQYATALHTAQAAYIDAHGGPEKFRPEPESESPEKTSGDLANIAAGGTEAITSIPATVGWLGNALSGGQYNPLLRGVLQPAGQAISHGLNTGLGYLGLNPENVEAKTDREKAERFASGALVSSLIPFGEATLAQRAASGARFAAGGAAASYLLPDELKPYAEFIGGLGTDLGWLGFRSLKDSVPAASLSPPALRRDASGSGSLVTTDADVLKSTAGKQASRIITEKLGGEANIPNVRAGLVRSPEAISPYSAYQQTGIPEIGQMETALQNKYPAEWNRLKQAQIEAQQAALQNIQTHGEPADLGDYLRGERDDINRKFEAKRAQLLEEAKQKLIAAGNQTTPEMIGDAVRDVSLQVEDAKEAANRALWDKVPKDQTGNFTPTIDKAKSILTEAAEAKTKLGADEKDLLERASNATRKGAEAKTVLEPIDKLGVAIQLRHDVSDAMAAELKTNGNSQKYRRLTQLRGAIEDNLGTNIKPGTDIPSPLTEPYQPPAKPVPVTTPSADLATQVGELTKDIPTADVTRATMDVREAKTARPASENLRDVIKATGGIRVRMRIGEGGRQIPIDEDKEIYNALGGKAGVRAGLISTKLFHGVAAANLAGELGEKGWFPEKPGQGTVGYDDLVSALGKDQGKSHFHPEDTVSAESMARDQLDQELTEAGVTSKDKESLAAAKLARYRADRAKAAEAAAKPAVEQDFPGFERQPQPGAAREREPGEDFEPGEEPAAATGAPQGASKPTEAPLPPPVRPTITQTGVDALATATADTKAKSRFLKTGVLGKILQRAGMSDLFRLGEDKIPGRIFQPGPSGFTAADEINQKLGAAGQPLLADAAVASLRKEAMDADGNLVVSKYNAWKNKYADALRALPANLKTGLEDAQSAVTTAGEVDRLRAETVAEMQKGALGRVMKAEAGDDVVSAVGTMINSGNNPVGNMRNLAQRARPDRAATEGLRQAITTFITRKFLSGAVIGATGARPINAASFTKFFEGKRAVLAEGLTPAQMQAAERIYKDIQMTSRKLDNMGRSTTARDTYEIGKGYQKISAFGRLFWDLVGGHAAAEAAGLAMTGIPGVGTAAKTIVKLGSKVAGVLGADKYQMMYNAGVENIDQVIYRAMSDPRFLDLMLRDAPRNIREEVTFTKALKRALATGTKASLPGIYADEYNQEQENQETQRQQRQAKKPTLVYQSGLQ